MSQHAVFAYISPAYINLPWDLLDLLPEGVEIIATSLGVSSYTDEEFGAAKSGIESAATKLAKAGAQAVIVAGNPLAVIPGRAAEQASYAALSEKLGVPVNSSLNAMLGAFKDMGRKNALVVNALPARINDLMRAYLESVGMSVGFAGAPVGSPAEALQIDRDAYVRMARDYVAGHAETDCILFEIRGNVRTLALQLEDELGLPVADSSRSALRWWLRTAGLDAKIKGGGRLLEA
jgi:maleate cis-trans isomerase